MPVVNGVSLREEVEAAKSRAPRVARKTRRPEKSAPWSISCSRRLVRFAEEARGRGEKSAPWSISCSRSRRSRSPSCRKGRTARPAAVPASRCRGGKGRDAKRPAAEGRPAGERRHPEGRPRGSGNGRRLRRRPVRHRPVRPGTPRPGQYRVRDRREQRRDLDEGTPRPRQPDRGTVPRRHAGTAAVRKRPAGIRDRPACRADALSAPGRRKPPALPLSGAAMTRSGRGRMPSPSVCRRARPCAPTGPACASTAGTGGRTSLPPRHRH